MSSGATETSTTTIYLAGAIITMDEALPRAQAVAVRDGRIAAVGSLTDVTARVGPDHVVDNQFSRRIMIPAIATN